MNLLVSFSGGETSAYMTYLLLTRMDHIFDDIRVAFANTGQEHPKTLDFIKRCDEELGFNTVWLEADVPPEKGAASRHKIVTFETASRNGEPFEAVIAKYGIPNTKYRHCTRELKLHPLQSYARSLGWGKEGRYLTAIGIRVDEIDRISTQARKRGLIYPLISLWPTRKADVNAWWASRPWRLEIKSYEGNCRWCWKKSDRKLFTLLEETPEIYEFPRRMEQKYSRVGAEMHKTADGRLPQDYRRTFFRGNRSTDDLIRDYLALKASGQFEPYQDERRAFDPALDVGGGCEESCEVYSDEDEP
jgi:hypothetical protein